MLSQTKKGLLRAQIESMQHGGGNFENFVENVKK